MYMTCTCRTRHVRAAESGPRRVRAVIFHGWSAAPAGRTTLAVYAADLLELLLKRIRHLHEVPAVVRGLSK